MGVSKNHGTPKSSILIGFSIINHPFWGPTPIFGNTRIHTDTVKFRQCELNTCFFSSTRLIEMLTVPAVPTRWFILLENSWKTVIENVMWFDIFDVMFTLWLVSSTDKSGPRLWKALRVVFVEDYFHWRRDSHWSVWILGWWYCSEDPGQFKFGGGSQCDAGEVDELGWWSKPPYGTSKTCRQRSWPHGRVPGSFYRWVDTISHTTSLGSQWRLLGDQRSDFFCASCSGGVSEARPVVCSRCLVCFWLFLWFALIWY